MPKYVLLFIILIFTGCKSKTSQKFKQEISIDSDKKLVNIENNQLQMKDTTGFLKDCNLLMTRSYIGALQVNNASSDSSGYLCFAACYTRSESFEIIFVYREGIDARKSLGYDSLGLIFNKGCNNNFSDFNCFAFVLPMRDPEKQEDIHAMNINFPVVVKIFKRIENDKWQYIKTTKVKTFEDYADLQFKTIYSEHH